MPPLTRKPAPPLYSVGFLRYKAGMKTQTSNRRTSSRVQYGLRDSRSLSGKAWAFSMPKWVNRAKGQEFRIVMGDSKDRYEYTIREVLQELEAAARLTLESAEDFDGMLRDSE